MLRVSDGKWTTNKILRAIATTGDTADLIGRTITGQTSAQLLSLKQFLNFKLV